MTSRIRRRDLGKLTLGAGAALALGAGTAAPIKARQAPAT